MNGPQRQPAPEGYLGTDARIDSGPAPELVAAGYGLEIADAALLHDGLHLADLAHVLELADAGLVPPDAAAALLDTLLEVVDIPAEEFPYDVTLGDAYNSRERELTRRIGTTAGWVHLGRTRREAGRIAFRLALLHRLLDLADATADLVTALAERAAAEAETVWADMTYWQPAQPSTFGHYLAAFAEEGLRHLGRIEQAMAWVDVSPAGSGGVAGTRLGLDRARLARRLGLDRVGRNTRDTMWTIDGLLDVVAAATQVGLTADRLAEDLEILASPGFGAVRLHGSLCRASVLMPQKRNPYALAVIRASASTLVGRLAGTATTARTPSGQTDNWLHSYGEVAGTVELATRVARLATAVVRGLELDRDALAAGAADVQVAATDLADEVVLVTGTDYRTAYRVVGRAVAVALETDGTLPPAALADAAALVAPGLTGLDRVPLADVTDPAAIVRSRREPGGCRPDRVRAECAEVIDEVAAARGDLRARRERLDRARAALLAEAAARVAGGADPVPAGPEAGEPSP